jgi:hypothetical protein
MKTNHRNTFTTIRTEGAILPPDLLQRVSDPSASSLEGLQPSDYHLFEGEKLNEAINRSWNRLIGAWENFKRAKEKVFEGQPGTTETRQRWLLPLFQELGYGRLQTSTAFNIEGKSYPISHGWERAPIHLLGFNIDLGKRTPGVAGASRTSPHSMVQEFLNRSDDHLWAFLSNGLQLRVLRDNISLTRQAYVEFDLEAMMDGEIYADFVLLWLLTHQSRVEGEKPEEFWLEQWSRQAQEQGTRALDQLRKGVEEAISSLGSGFLRATNPKLRANLRSGTLSPQDYYRQLLRMVYRLIFLFVAEDRNLLFPPKSNPIAQQRYGDYYSTQRLRRLAERSRGLRHADLYYVLRLVTEKLSSVAGSPELALPALGGFLFSADATPDLDVAALPNQNLLDAVRALAYTVDGRTLRSVDYKNLGPEELGSVYESLLELHPEMNVDAGTFNLTSASGHERKTTGSYYTPSSLIQVLLDSALDPVLAERLKNADASPEAREAAILDLKVCDPAVGSGHFLIAAAHRLARHLAGIRTGDDEPSPDATRAALRDVIGNCLYGVDLNPMAVELCKVSLWMEALEPGKPLSFLDAHIKCGNSLVGVGPNLDISEIPDNAFKPAFGDDKKTATALRRRNKRERTGQIGMRWDVTHIQSQEDLAQWVTRQSQNLETMPEDQADQVRAKAQAYESLLSTPEYLAKRLEYDLWTAAFFWQIPEGDAEKMLAPSQQELTRLRSGKDSDAELTRRIQEIAEKQRFFHWEFEFPTVFSRDDSGFDVVLGNPPWEKIQFEEQAFFASKNPEISNAKGATRKRLIQALKKSDAHLFQQFTLAKKDVKSLNDFIKFSGGFPLTGWGKMNTYAIFSEQARLCLNRNGNTGILVPLGISTDDNNKLFFADLIKQNELIALLGFENEEFIFLDVHHAFKFVALIFAGRAKKAKQAKYVFYCRNVSQTRQELRGYSMSYSDIVVLNPNTLTAPVFRNRIDAEINRKIYKTHSVIKKDNPEDNPWNVAIHRMFNPTDDSSLFYKRDELNLKNLHLDNNTYSNEQETYLPIYEAKMFHQFDHRFGTYEGQTTAQANQGKLPELNETQHQDPLFISMPRYWMKSGNANELISSYTDREWLLAFRDITSSVVFRTTISAIIPSTATVDPCRHIFFDDIIATNLINCFVGCLNSLVFDYCSRQKISGSHLAIFVLKQLPVLSPNVFKKNDIEYISSRIFELVYTAQDLKPFAEDMGYTGPPFRWDEERRAILRAELDAYYAHLYGLNRKQLRYILDPADLTPAELKDILDPWEEVANPLDAEGYTVRAEASDFPGETFRVLKNKENKKYGEYRTRRLVLEAWERLSAVNFDVDTYVPMTNPPPADPRVAHPNRDGSVYEGPGLVIDAEQLAESSEVKEEQAEYEVPAQEEKAVDTSDYGLYKCQDCGTMVMGFAKDDHVRDVHGGESQGFEGL